MAGSVLGFRSIAVIGEDGYATNRHGEEIANKEKRQPEIGSWILMTFF